MKGLEEISNFFRNYTNNFSAKGIITLVFDILLILFIIVFFVLFISQKKKIKYYKVLLIIVIELGLFVISVLFGLKLFCYVVMVIAFWTMGVFIIAFAQEIKHFLEGTPVSNKTNSSFTSSVEKKQVIDIICSTALYLSKRKVGALITIERNDPMDEYIQNAIRIDGIISQEIMTTIFTPGTACHDGAIIVRKNIIKCAGAYFPSTLKYDVPKSLGSRHRAAIGISEHVDAITVVVSEQTGGISVTLDGIIYQNLTQEKLQDLLDTHLLEEE